MNSHQEKKHYLIMNIMSIKAYQEPSFKIFTLLTMERELLTQLTQWMFILSMLMFTQRLMKLLCI